MRVVRWVLLIAGVSLCGCSSNSADWMMPDWDRVLRDEDGRVDEGVGPARPALRDPVEPPSLAGDGPIELSVEQAVLLSLRQNRDLTVAQLAPEVTGAFELVERGRFDPEVFAEYVYDRREAVETARSTGEQFGVRSDADDLVGGIRQELPAGTDVEVYAGIDRDASSRAPEQREARVGLTVTQSLLRGFGPAVNLASVRVAQLDTEASRFELRGFTESLVAEAEAAYWRYLLAMRTIEIVERSLEVERRQADEIAQRIAVGVLAKTEAVVVRSELALRQQALINAKSALRARRLDLLRLMDLPFTSDEDRVIVPLTAPSIEGGVNLDDEEDRVALGGRGRPDLGEARLRLEQGRLETVRTRNGLLPRLDVFIGFAKTGYGATFNDAFEAMDEDTYDFSVGVGFSQSLERSRARGAYAAALASRRQAAAAVGNLEQLVELDVRLGVNEARRAMDQIDATSTTRRLQEETVAAELERFNAGASTALLVAQTQRDLLEAEIREAEALIDFRIALIRLYLAEGSLLDRRGIVTE